MSDDAVYKTLLESTKAIPWKIDWATMKFAYIGPQIEELLGWTPESWQTVEDWATRMHPDDRQWVVDFCVAQSKAGIDHEADYRAATADGSYRWIRDVVHVVRHPSGEVQALVGFMFDISERKRTEERLMVMQREHEDLSFKDGLTGLLNRRRFDALLATEWGAAKRTKQPLSLIMIDIDLFKQYNDRYGHVRGDECLKKVAAALTVLPSVMDLEGSELFASLIVSSVGLVVLGYGKHRQRLPHVIVGLVLIAFPYVVPNAVLIAVIAAALLGGLWLATRFGL